MPEYKKLDIMACSIALGLVCAVGALLLGLMGAVGWGTEMVRLIGTLYLGFAPTPVGSLIGGLWGLADGLVAGAIFAWLYNRLAR